MNLPARSAAIARRIQGVTAVLGPTNTGKTHLAIERMLAHESGIIGLPLRLLAREVYGRIAARAGGESVALITGEEKIKPASPRYWVCTVEAMPRDVDASFLAVDEIQLAADFERGHVFTDRMLHARGRDETLLLGAATMRPLVEQLLPGVSIVTRPRLSALTYAGEKKITRLPRRSAIVAFSADEVYAIAELIRRQRGGAAVVLGALSPRTRNAQVALYQSGDVDFLVATDAIGMGLNLDVDHVAFAQTRKFDGYHFRNLTPAELGQVAGRAGRYTRDGTFGVTGQVEPFASDLARALEAHDFEPLKMLQWRNSDLDFASLDALRRSLSQVPREPGLTRAPIGEDVAALEIAVRDDDIRVLARGTRAVQRLWEVCQVPDYRKIAPASHAELVFTLFRFLMDRAVPTDWFARQIAYADRTDGDIDTLSNRIAHVRTWSFVANRADWLDDPAHWQSVTQAVEDKLSDALHDRLTQRFVDRRTSTLMRRLRENAMLEAEITPTGDVLVEGHHVGRLDGFRFAPDASAEAVHGRALRAAAQKALAAEIETRAARISALPDQGLVLAGGGLIRWEGQPIAQLTPGDRALSPQVRLLADEQLTGGARDRVQERLDTFVRHHITTLLRPLLELEKSEGLEGLARGLAYRMVEELGVVERNRVAEEVRQLDQAARAKLRALGVRFGAYHVYLPQLLKPAPRGLVALLWALGGDLGAVGLDELPVLAASGRTSLPVDAAVPKGLYRAMGYRVCGTRAVRIDILERLADLIRPALAWREGGGAPRPDAAVPGGFRITPAMTSLLGCSAEEVGGVLKSLGYRAEKRRLPKVLVTPPQSPRTATDMPAAETEATAEAEPIAEVDDAAPAAEEALEAPQSAAAEQTAAEPDASEAAAAAPEPVASEPPADAPDAEPASPAEITAPNEVSAAPSADAAEDVAAEAEAATPAAEETGADELVEIEVWRPGRFERRDKPQRARPERERTRPERRDGQAPRPQRPERGEQSQEVRHGAASRPGPQHQRRRPPASAPRPERRERAPDPDSPFAALAKLKAELEARDKRDG